MKKASVIIIFLLLLTLGTTKTQASIVTIDKAGRITVNVLASATPLAAPVSSELAIKEIKPETDAASDSRVSLSRENGRIAMSILSAEGERTLDVRGPGGPGDRD